MKPDELPQLPFRGTPPRIRTGKDSDGETTEIYDILRNKFVALTPEEWVRQNVTAYLAESCGYSLHRMSNEYGIKLNRTGRRCDTVVFNDNAEPVMIIEYKAPHVALTRKVFDQILRYNTILKARYLLVSNGLRLLGLECDTDNPAHPVKPLTALPSFDTLRTISTSRK